MVDSHRDIKDRLLKTAAIAWGLPAGQTEENFDPLVGLLFGACATELEKISNDIADTRSRTLERLVNLLYPEVLARAIPAHGIAYAYPSEPSVLLQADAQFYFQKRAEAPSEGAAATWKNIYFSPTSNFPIYKTEIKFMAGTSALYGQTDVVAKSLVAIGRDATSHHPLQNCLWLGVEGIENIEGEASFYFDLKMEAGRNVFYDYLHLAKWTLNGQELSHSKHYGNTISVSHKPDPQEIVSGQTNTMNRVLRNINQFYSQRFITVKFPRNLPSKEKWPKELGDVYQSRETDRLNPSGLHWIKIDFPQNIEVAKMQQQLFVSLNCIPVVNRHLVISQQKLMEHVNIIPLVSDENFLDLSDITDMSGNSLHGTEEGKDAINLHFGGIERFNEKTAMAAVEAIIQQLRDESIAFSNIGNDFLNAELRSLQQTLNRLEQQVRDKQLLKGDTPYILIPDRDKIATSNIYIKYWTTNGQDANSIKAGASLSLYKNADVQSNSVRMITNAQGGRNSLANSDKVLAYKTALLNKEKLVTEEDIAVFCRLRLGIKDAQVNVRKGFKVQNNNSGGFIKIIEVHISLHQDDKATLMQRGEIDMWEKDLAYTINEQSNFFMPLSVYIK